MENEELYKDRLNKKVLEEKLKSSDEIRKKFEEQLNNEREEWKEVKAKKKEIQQ